jgi:hypothetical protein
MLEWFVRVGYDANVAALEREFGFHTTRMKDWARNARPLVGSQDVIPG